MNVKQEISRSHFLRNAFKTFFEYTARAVSDSVSKAVDKTVLPLHRPPGAVDELTFLMKCTKCDKCIGACPHNSLKRADVKYGAAFGTPVIEPSETPCYLCEDFPCIDSCPEEALLPGTVINMGTAHLIPNKCFAYQGQVCDYCYMNCPLKNDAIVMENGRPRINEVSCNGCGICEYLCPAPGKGILTLPERNMTESWIENNRR